MTMLTKICLVLIVSVLSATKAFNKPPVVCTEDDIGNGEIVKDCSDDTQSVVKDGHVEQFSVFKNDTMELVQFSNSSDCYIARSVHFPDGFSGILEADMEAVAADNDLSNEMNALAQNKCTGTVYDLIESTEDPQTAARRKRACVTRYRVVFFYRYFIINGTLYRRRYIVIYRRRVC